MKLNIDEINLLKINIAKLIKDIDNEKKILLDINSNNTEKNKMYKDFIQEIIFEYHNVCKKLFF